MPRFMGCDDCCDQGSATPCGNAPNHTSSGWPFSESLWSGYGYTTGSILSYTPSLTGFVSHASSWSVSSNSGLPAPSMSLEMEASINIDGVDGQMAVLDYIMFDDDIVSSLCNTYISAYYLCCHIKGSLRTWSEANLSGDSIRYAPTVGIVVERGGFYRFCTLATGSGTVSRTQWTRLSSNNAISGWCSVVPGATGSVGVFSAVGPNTNFLTTPPPVHIGVGIYSKISCFANPDSVSVRSMEIPSLRIDNVNMDYAIASAANGPYCASQTESEREAGIALAVSGASHMLTQNAQISVTPMAGFDCDSSDMLNVRCDASSNSWAAGVFLPVHEFSGFDDYIYLKLWGACLSYRLFSGNCTWYLHPAVRIDGNVYAGRFAHTSNSTTTTVLSRSTPPWPSANCSMSLLSDVVYTDYGPVGTTFCRERVICNDVNGYGRPQTGYGGRVTGVSASYSPTQGYPYLIVDSADRPVCSWTQGSLVTGGIYLVATGIFGGQDMSLGIRQLFAEDASNNNSSTFLCVVDLCWVAKQIIIEVIDGANAGTYVIDFLSPTLDQGSNSYPICYKQWVIATTPVRFAVTYLSSLGVGLTYGGGGQTWVFPSAPSAPWGGVTTINLSLQGTPAPSPYASSAVKVTYDMSW